ncbi:MAG: hypothetical protein ACJ8AS_13195 [Hyphomicrobiales bacterium]
MRAAFPIVACGALYLCGSLVSLAQEKSRFTLGLDDPRSGAKLNLLAAKRHGPARPGSPGARTILPGTVNNPSADTTAQDTQSETSVVDLGGGRLIAAFNDSGSFIGGASHFTGFAFSSDNGKTWTDGGALPASSGGDAGDPNLAYRSVSNSVFLATLGFNTGNTIQVFKSTDSGHTWGAPVNAFPGIVGGDLDKEWIAIDNFAGSGNGNIYACSTNFGGVENIVFSRSTDGGATFGPAGATLISTGGQGCFVVVAPNHNVFVFYYRGTGSGGQGGDNKLFVRRSTNRGVSFAAEAQVADLNTTTVNGGLQLNGGLRSNSFPHATASANGNLYVVYNDDPNLADGSDNGDVFYVRSTDNGATWSAKTRVPGNANRDQFFPTIAFSGSGRAMIGYYSRSQDPSNFMFHRRAVLARVDAAGDLAFNSNTFQLSPNTPIVIGQDPVINSTYMGDYDQIAGGTAYLSGTWSDNRLGNGFHARQPDVRFAKIKARAPIADLAVRLRASATNINVGDNTTITVTLSSTGGVANDVFFNASPTVGLPIQSLSSGSCALINGFAGCSLQSIADAGSKTVRIVVNGQSAGVNSFIVTGTTSSNDGAAGNNTDTINITVSP